MTNGKLLRLTKGKNVQNRHILLLSVQGCFDKNIFMILLFMMMTIAAIFCVIPILKSKIFYPKINLTDLSEHPNVRV